jgi:hypothetical protein
VFRYLCQPLAASSHLTDAPLHPKGAAMQCGDLKQLRSELVQLIEKQIEELAKETCNRLTEKELREYEDRKKRIDELYASLYNLGSAA